MAFHKAAETGHGCKEVSLGTAASASRLVRLESCGQAVQRFVCTGHVPGNLPMQRLRTCTCTGGEEERAFDGESDAILFMVSVQMLRNKACDTSNSTVRTALAPHASNDMGVVVQVPDREDKRALDGSSQKVAPAYPTLNLAMRDHLTTPPTRPPETERGLDSSLQFFFFLALWV
ncbi:hypothetical protein M431DRAFT_479373 [Trichoderma harzianum CBS 226.95]|uniref:Uncharacterized protein n=1 Tax=Trichoderma harzianum CBS 226.95 TaxID=983964 RepID=A0A2T4AL60_TRIHA|nr:hypothetical protein M431DRAFT_479373 [Trichoderma harzianum CBS 226.95]PTB57815.1 hypothetical protein M431DRAFT_479373 [Trichoderma harzianum CBS 226.95]